MGLLDDAIRDHLDLKRRRGADPVEVERAEREALGPVRRAPVEPAEGELALGPPAHEDEYVGDEHVQWDEHFEAATQLHAVQEAEPVSPAPFEHDPLEHDPLEHDLFEPEAAEHERFEHEPLASEPHASEPVAAVPAEPLAPEPPPPAVHEPEPFAPEAEPEPEAEEHEPRRRRGLFGRRESASDATVEYDVEGALDAEEEDGTEAEDVLEETPEFLQDTPDHDRLWFEQKPPKDFDFDG
jgi:hypothetical protein